MEEIKDREAVWYDEKYTVDPGSFSYLPRWYDDITRGVRPYDNVIDLGCGEGKLLDAVMRKTSADFRIRWQVRTIGVDVSPVAVRMARAKGLSAHCNNLDRLDNLNGWSRHRYEHVFCCGVLEHLADQTGAVKLIKSLMSDAHHTKAYVVAPNFKFILRRFGWGGTGQVELREVPRPLDGWIKLFGVNGLVVESVRRDYGVLERRTWANNWLGRLAMRLLPLKWTYQFIFTLKKGV